MSKPIRSLVAALTAMLPPFALSATVMAADKPMTNQVWWPNVLDLSPLRQHDAGANPYDADFDYAAEFKTLCGSRTILSSSPQPLRVPAGYSENPRSSRRRALTNWCSPSG